MDLCLTAINKDETNILDIPFSSIENFNLVKILEKVESRKYDKPFIG